MSITAVTLEIKKNRAKQIKIELLRRDMSVADLARACKTNRTWMSLIIHGHRQSRRVQRCAARILGVSYKDLWNGNNGNSGTSAGSKKKSNAS